MIPGAARIDGELVRTEVLHGLTGRHWIAWRFGGYWGRRYVIRVFLRFMRSTQATLDERPMVIVFPDGYRYRILNVDGDHRAT